MLTITIAVSALLSTVFAGRYFITKNRLSEKAIEQVIANKLAKSPLVREIESLREENGVMRNLLIDIVENEASLANAAEMTDAQRSHALKARTQRRRELFGEALLAIRMSQPSFNLTQKTRIDSRAPVLLVKLRFRWHSL